MSLVEQIEKRLRALPPEKQMEALDFILRLQQQALRPASKVSLKQHPAFGLWKSRGIDSLRFQEQRRAEWDR